MSAHWTCAFCGGPVKRTPTGLARKHKEWRVDRDGHPYETDVFCEGRAAQPPDRDLERQYRALVAERYGAPWSQ